MAIIETILRMSLVTALVLAGEIQPDPEFSRLQKVLEGYGFTVKIEPPPIRGAYGMFKSDARTLWIHPITFDLGIAQPTLIHEAVHAAQLCHGGKTVRSLGLTLPPPPMTRRFFLADEGYSRQIEAEAYTVQVQPDGLPLVMSLLQKHCRPVVPKKS
jgi:hypothetical protein